MKGIRNCFILFLFLIALPFSALGAALNINKANVNALAKAMVGVGPAKAAAIVEFRENNGPFKSIAELIKVKGIGSVTVEANRDKISIE